MCNESKLSVLEALGLRCGGPIFVVVLVVAICSVTFIFVYPTATEGFPGASLALQVLQVVFSCGMLVFLVLTNAVDPGTVTKDHAPAEIEMRDLVAPEERRRNFKQSIDNPGGFSTDYRWCDTCQLWKPPRASHCSICRRCYERFDHHCPWVGTCVARCNHRFFCAFLFCIGIAGTCVPASMFLSLAVLLASKGSPTGGWTDGMMITGLVGICAACCFAPCIIQGISQGVMLCVNLTTKEAVQGDMCELMPSDLEEAKLRCAAGRREVCLAPCKIKGLI